MEMEKCFLLKASKSHQRSKTYIKACNFLFQDKDIIQLLKEAAKEALLYLLFPTFVFKTIKKTVQETITAMIQPFLI